MATEISLDLFEKNAKNANKKGLLRGYNSIPQNYKEYIAAPAASFSDKLVLEVTVDKGSVDALIELIKNEDFVCMGEANYFFFQELIKNYYKNRKYYGNVNPDAIRAIEKDVDNMVANNKPYKEIENDDAVFYMIPYNSTIETFFEFVKTKKDLLLEFAKKEDITIMFKILSSVTQLDGFFGVNFFDADKGDENVIIDYASRITVGVDFKDKNSVYNAAALLTKIGETKEELEDKELNVHIVCENAKNL